MDHALESMLPLFSPLPGSVATHLLLGKRRRHRKAPVPPLASVFEQETGYTQAEWDRLLQLVHVTRTNVFMRMEPLQLRDELTTSWLLAALADATPQKNTSALAREEIAQASLSEWTRRGLISFQARNRPNPHQAAALLIARIIDSRIRNWLPTHMTADEAWSWCWRQDSPGLVPVPCPIPLPSSLPRGALLVDAWPGRAWDAPWTAIDTIGAARWAGATLSGGRVTWDITLEELQQWDPPVAALFIESTRDIIQRLADTALVRLAWAQLQR